MADQEQLEILKQGVSAWNAWRQANPTILWPDLGGASLRGAGLYGVNLSYVNLSEADLSHANLSHANLSHANISWAKLSWTNLSEANLSEANLFRADLSRASLRGASLYGANLSEAHLFQTHLSETDLSWATLSQADLSQADLSETDLSHANLSHANLSRANLSRANLSRTNIQGASLVETNLTDANLTGCRIYGMSAWDLRLGGAKQDNLIITRKGQAEITVDNIEVGQFIYLLLHNEKMRDFIDTITSKAVLILGRFTPERKTVLDALRDELRKHNRTPIIFDFSGPRSKDTTDTVKLLAQMARYIIIDLSDPNSAPYELGVISMLGLKTTPVVPIIVSNQKPFPMLDDVLRERWSTELIKYRDLDDLRVILDTKLVSVAEDKVRELRGP